MYKEINAYIDIKIAKNIYILIYMTHCRFRVSTLSPTLFYKSLGPLRSPKIKFNISF